MRIYVAIFLATLSTVVLPLPEEAALMGAGYAARIGTANLAGAVAATFLAVFGGDVMSYWFGRSLVRRVAMTRLGSRVVPPRWMRWAESFVAEHGGRTVVIARFLVGVRGFLYYALGASAYPFGRFLVINAAAGLVEVTALVVFGFALGAARTSLGVAADLVAAALLALALFAPTLVRRVVGRSP